MGISPNLNIITTATPEPDPQPSTPEDVAPTPVLTEICPPQCEGDLEPSIVVAEADRSVYLSNNFETLEAQASRDVTDYLGLAPIQPASLEATQEALRDIERLTGIKPAIIYVSFQPRRVTLPTALPGTLPSSLADPNAALKLGTTVSVLSPQPKNLDAGLSDRPTAAKAPKSPVQLNSSTAIAPVTNSSAAVPIDSHSPTVGSPPADTVLWQWGSELTGWEQGASLELAQGIEIERQPDDELELLIVTAEGDPVRVPVPQTRRDQVERLAQLLRQEIATPSSLNSQRYLVMSQRLYQWIVQPLEETLADREVNNLLFVLETGLRTLPIAALHDGEQFLIEKYSTGLAPSISLTNLVYRDVRGSQMLAMGASEFPQQNQNPLPMVPVELETLVGPQGIWSGQQVLNQNFNRTTLQEQSQGYGVIHLATHADFAPGSLDRSYIQLYSDRFSLLNLRDLNWRTSNQDNPVELLTLSACQTAVGSHEAELGFAGLAVQAGVKSALASLWYVSDAATTSLMTQFYRNLKTVPVKAEALRQAQIAMARGQVQVAGDRLVGEGLQGTVLEGLSLPEGSLVGLEAQDFSHPYYWSAFTLVGSPW